MTDLLNQVKGVVSQPDQEIFKIGPEVIQDFIAKVIIMMGGSPDDIQNVQVGQDKKRLRILATVEKDSKIFVCDDEKRAHRGLTLMGASEVREGVELTQEAKDTLEQLGYSYIDDDDRKVLMVDVTDYKKGVEIEFNAEVTMAIITDSNFSDPYFVVDAIEEVLKKKKHNSHKFKGKKRTIVFARVQRAAKGDEEGFHPDQVTDWKTGESSDDDDDDEDEEC